MKDNIRVFLESPRSMELINNPIIEKGKIYIPKRRKGKKKRTESLPPYIPYKSVYQRTDFDKMTERQKLLALKFQTNYGKVSSLFLTVHGISIEDTSETNKKLLSNNKDK